MRDPGAGDNKAAEVVANRLRMAGNYLRDARMLQSAGSRTSSFCLFMAAELILLAVLTSEGIHASSRDVQHQLAAMTDRLPEENPLKETFRLVEGLTAFATTFRYTTAYGRIPAGMPDAEFGRRLHRSTS